MKKKNGWLYAFWILLMVVLILALAVGLISWAGSRNEDEVEENGEEIETMVLSVSISGTLALAYGDETGTALTANVTMSDGGDYEGDYAWTSSDDEEEVVKIAGSGATVTVTPVFCGTAEITVSVGEGDNVETDTCTVTVSEDHTAAVAGRITEVQADDERLSAGNELAFTATDIRVSYDETETTYTIDGVSEAFTEDLAKAFWVTEDVTAHADCRYITFELNAGAGETLAVTTYNGETEEKTYAMYGDGIEGTDTTDGVFVLDLTDHTEGAWRMEIEVAYAGGDEEIYTVVLGDIEIGVADETDLISVFDEGGVIALTEDITLTDDGQTGTTASKSEVQAGGSGRVQSPLYVASGVEVTLDLNGHTLARNGKDTGGYIFCTILVMAGGTLTVVDSSEAGTGVVDVTGHGNECLYNYGGTVTLEGGFFTRSKENGMSESNNGDGTEGGAESSYTIQNYGDLTIDGATVYNAGDYSTCVRSQGIDANNSASLTMISGKIYGGKYAVGSGSSSSDIHATFTMTGGTLGGLRSDTDALPYRALNNYDEATVTGGTLLGGNGGAIDVGGKADACVEGVVIFNEDGGTGDTLTIGDGKGNGPEIIYEGINPNAAVAGDNQPEETRMSYYDEAAGSEIPAFATGIAAYSGEVDINAGTIKCSDTATDRDYNFMGVYLTNGTLKVTGGSISGDEAILIDCTAETSSTIAISITGGTLNGNIAVYTKDENGEVVSSVYTPGRVTAVADASDTRLGPFSPTDITAWYDPSTNTYTIDGASVAFGENVSDFWGSSADSHTDCQYIAFEINVGADETLKITAVDADGETVKVRAMYGSNVAAKTLTDDEGESLKEADGVWIIDVTKEDDHEGSFKMTIEVIGADGTVSETYYVVIGTISSSVAA